MAPGHNKAWCYKEHSGNVNRKHILWLEQNLSHLWTKDGTLFRRRGLSCSRVHWEGEDRTRQEIHKWAFFLKYFYLPIHLFNVFSEKWYGNSWKDVELALYTDTVLAWHDEVCYLSLFQINVFSNPFREERCWGAPSWSTRLTWSLRVSTPAASLTDLTRPLDTHQVSPYIKIITKHLHTR